MEPPKLGSFSSEHEKRDAVHVAILPVKAGCHLWPGERVSLDSHQCARRDNSPEWNGVVDPFLTQKIELGQWFWLCLRPGSITSLRHDWTHPQIPAAVVTNDHAAWGERMLRQFTDEWGIGYGELLDAIAAGEVYCFGDDSHPYIQDHPELFSYVEAIVGRAIPKTTTFRCAC